MPGKKELRCSITDLCAGRLSGRVTRNEGGAWIPGRAARGLEIHRLVEARLLQEIPGAKSEVDLQWSGELAGHKVRLSGRADVLHPLGMAEELKTVLADPGAFKRYRSEQFPGYCMQALLYSWLAAGEGKVYARLRLINLLDGAEKVFKLESTVEELRRWAEVEFGLYLAQQEKFALLCGDRQAQAEVMQFPFREPRPGQRDLVDQIQRVLKSDGTAVLNAPTGLGKSISVLYPALQEALRNDTRVVYATAKNTGREAALLAARSMIDSGTKLKVVAMASRENMCPNDVYFCHEEHCPFLRNMEQGLVDSLDDLENTSIVTQKELEAAGRKHRVCPHELALSLCETRDLVIGDYNYVFDPRVRIRRLFVDGDPSRLSVLIDEAHNLPARARGWFSQEITSTQLAELRRVLRDRAETGDLFTTSPLLKTYERMDGALKRLENLWDSWQDCLTDQFHFENCNSAEIPLEPIERAQADYESAIVSYMLLRVVHAIVVPKDPLIQFYFELSRFLELLRRESPAMHHLVNTYADDGVGVQVLCSWAGDHLEECIKEFRNCVLFSATLKPWDFHLQELGISDLSTLIKIDVPSPFPDHNRQLLIHAGLSTRYADRGDSLGVLRNLCMTLYEQAGGNTAVFLPSFSYLKRLHAELPSSLPLLVHDGPIEPGLRQAFLRRLKQKSPRLLLTVMGGIFAEAVDYPGDMLKAALIVGPGLPGLSYERELAKRYYSGRGEDGFALAYRLPGLGRVIQAAGRVIRTPSDRGSIIFVDDRFLDFNHRGILEQYYDCPIKCYDSAHDIVNSLGQFWGNSS